MKKLAIMLVVLGGLFLSSCEKESTVEPTYCWECEGTDADEGKAYFFCDLTEEEIGRMENNYAFTCTKARSIWGTY